MCVCVCVCVCVFVNVISSSVRGTCMLRFCELAYNVLECTQAKGGKRVNLRMLVCIPLSI